MKISSISSFSKNDYKNLSSVKVSNNIALASSPNKGITFTGKQAGVKKLFEKILPKGYDHEFLPKTVEEALEYIKKNKRIWHNVMRHDKLDYHTVTAYKRPNQGIEKDVHCYLFTNKGKTLLQSATHDSYGRTSKVVYYRPDGTKSMVQHYVNGIAHNHEEYRADGTLCSIGKFDEKYEFLGFQEFDKTGTIETSFQPPERHSGDMLG